MIQLFNKCHVLLQVCQKPLMVIFHTDHWVGKYVFKFFLLLFSWYLHFSLLHSARLRIWKQVQWKAELSSALVLLTIHHLSEYAYCILWLISQMWVIEPCGFTLPWQDQRQHLCLKTETKRDWEWVYRIVMWHPTTEGLVWFGLVLWHINCCW